MDPQAQERVRGRTRQATDGRDRHRSATQGRPADSAELRDSLTDSAAAPRLARTIVAVTTSGYFIVAVMNMMVRRLPAAELFWGIAALLGVLLLQNLHSLPDRSGRRPRYWVWTLSAQAVLTYVPFLVYKSSWVGMPGFLAGSVLLWLPLQLSLIGFGVVLGSLVAIQSQLGFDWYTNSFYTVGAAISGLTVFGLTRLVDLISEVRRARAELARLAVAEERSRVARDLHDLLGYSLSAITLKGELVYRLVTSQPDRARAEVSTMLAVSRQALSDVRTVAQGYRDMSLASEAAAARAILISAEIDTDVSITCGTLDDDANTVLATVVREGVTNLLRHSKAQHCTIRAERDGEMVRLVLENDGLNGAAVTAAAKAPAKCSGLANLRVRIGALRGTLDAGASEDGWFRLVAQVPAASAAVPDDGAAPTPDPDAAEGAAA
ncbi:histidine kinase [Streptomyces sp. RB6PN25]|uniref:Histidine kinase n=1 Tax=Streptomyces humicola TaxID=2953240 RepID=A0ABT1Q626_9ACTN|nr:histidine kinase [Streptomyces humicola]MCQ4084275.1 histidine kinase [Streptomyces humicola]